MALAVASVSKCAGQPAPLLAPPPQKIFNCRGRCEYREKTDNQSSVINSQLNAQVDAKGILAQSRLTIFRELGIGVKWESIGYNRLQIMKGNCDAGESQH
jgi:hypothetical protein